MRIPRELRQAHDLATSCGWRIEPTHGGHLRWVPPTPGSRFIITSSSPSDRRAATNVITTLRRAGLPVPR